MSIRDVQAHIGDLERRLEMRAEIGLEDPAWEVRMIWAKRTDWTPTQEQAERGLLDSDREIQAAWVKRTDWTGRHQ